MRVSAMLLACFLLAGGLSARAQDQPADPIAELLSGKRDLQEQAKKEMMAAREKQIAGLLALVNDPALRQKDRLAVLAAIEVLGELRAEQAAPVLAQLLLFGHEGDIRDETVSVKAPRPPHRASPAVQALIRIGMPSLRPVTDRLLSLDEQTPNKNTLGLHCHWVIKGVLGPRLGKAYLMQLCETDERAKNSRFVRDGFGFMELFMKHEKE